MRYRPKHSFKGVMENLLVLLVPLLVGVYPLASWLTHVVVTIQQEAWGLLIAGALLFPIGIVHGTLIWLGLG